MAEVHYYGFISAGEGRGWTEVLARRENGRRVSDEPTGVTYRTFRDAENGVFAKNRIIAAAMRGPKANVEEASIS